MIEHDQLIWNSEGGEEDGEGPRLAHAQVGGAERAGGSEEQLINFSHCSLAKLASVVLEEEHNHVKPRMITTTWSDSPWHVLDRRRGLPTT